MSPLPSDRPVWVRRYPEIRALAALLLMTVAGVGMYATIVALKPIGAEFGVSRSLASLPYAATMIGLGFGGVVQGWLADRLGAVRVALAGALLLPLGFWLAAQAGALWQLVAIQAGLIGFLGYACFFAPLVSDITHWFHRRRGMAVAVVISGSYVAGAVWPPIVQLLIDAGGWRGAYQWIALVCLVLLLPLSLVLRPRPPRDDGAAARAAGVTDPAEGSRPLGLPPNLVQAVICLAGIGCCVAMAMPQVHIVAYATDLGHAAQRGAEMLAIMLGCGIVSRLASGWIADRVGGLATLLLGSTLQLAALVLFMPASSLAALYAVSALFGLSQGGIVPSYALIVRLLFPASAAGWRIGTALLATILGMALGAWMAGALYDLSGDYRLSFVNAILFNILNFGLAGFLLLRFRRLAAAAAPA